MSKTIAKTYVAIVEDDESLCRSIARLLQASGYQPVSYFSAEAFFDDTKRPDFDCLIVDIQLGGMSGIDFNNQLTSTGSTTPVIFLTAHEKADELQQQLHTHCAAFLRKSDPAETVIAAIDNAINANNKGVKSPS